jgi:hypothetical protein
MTRFPLRVTKRIKTRRKEEKKREKKNEEEKRWSKRGVYPKGITLTLVCCVFFLYGKVNLKRQMLVVCCFMMNLIWEP